MTQSANTPILDLTDYDPTPDGAFGYFQSEAFWRFVPEDVREKALAVVQAEKDHPQAPVTEISLDAPHHNFALSKAGGNPGLRFHLWASSSLQIPPPHHWTLTITRLDDRGQPTRQTHILQEGNTGHGPA